MKLRVFKSKEFARFARKAGIHDDSLVLAVKEIERGLIDADLGGGVIKQRVRRPNSGKSGGFRTILLVRRGELMIFIDGFAKSERANISANELLAFREIAKGLLWSDEKLASAIRAGVLQEIDHEN